VRPASANCTSGTYGYDAGPAYDQATGWAQSTRITRGWGGAVRPSGGDAQHHEYGDGASFRQRSRAGDAAHRLRRRNWPLDSVANTVPLPTKIGGYRDGEWDAAGCTTPRRGRSICMVPDAAAWGRRW